MSRTAGSVGPDAALCLATGQYAPSVMTPPESGPTCPGQVRADVDIWTPRVWVCNERLASGRHAISDRGHVLDRLPLPNVRPPPHRSRCLPEAQHIGRSGRVQRAEPSWVSRGYIACVRIPDGARPNYAGYPDPRLPLRGARRMLQQTVWQIGIQAQIGARASTAPRIVSPRLFRTTTEDNGTRAAFRGCSFEGNLLS